MRKIVIIALLTSVALGTIALFRMKDSEKIEIVPNDSVKATERNEMPATESSDNENPLSVSGWLPYWAADRGIASLDGNLGSFSEINPFAFEADRSGKIIDKLGFDSEPWTDFRQKAANENVHLVPTLLWTDAEAMHRILSDEEKRRKHVESIADLLEKYSFPGVDIDYEGKDVADKENFSALLKELQNKLSAGNRTLSCTVEARTQDEIPQGLTGTRAMSYANDPKAMAEYCDTVRVMAYDQVFQIHRSYQFEEAGSRPSAPNADDDWVKENIAYFSKYVPKEKLILGIPTYGWEFRITKTKDGYSYARTRSLTYPQAVSLAKEKSVAPERTAGGELSFAYLESGREHLVTFEDAESISRKIEIAKEAGLAGISLFKIDGEADPGMFGVLKEK